MYAGSIGVHPLLMEGIQLAVGTQPLRLQNHNFGLAHRIMGRCGIMVKRLATSPHDPLGITDSACKNQLVVVSVQYGPFNTYIPIRSTTIGKSRVARDPIAMHTSWRSNSDIASVTRISTQRMKANGESSTTKHRLLHASGPHPISPPNDPNLRHQIRSITLAQYQRQAAGNQTQATEELTIVDIYSQLDNQQAHANRSHQLVSQESFSSVHSQITVLCSTADSVDVKVADPPVVSTADPDFLLLQLVHLSPNSPADLIHLTAAQLLMTSRLLKSSISLDDVTTAEYFYC
ncbi:hypothetical protein F511_38175 [Dorcoceras hygrometricum]|uniref:Uncharacterized protein n=1 Tax=Dorcoceras hygrometricum TaxID=472368 RepID=A0A2Z7BHC9_9LAMI|nr:hypothetical protein F511_38175 [Dorcoceras hygrometricum]